MASKLFNLKTRLAQDNITVYKYNILAPIELKMEKGKILSFIIEITSIYLNRNQESNSPKQKM